LGFNTAGAALAPVLIGVVLLGAVGIRNALLLVSCGYLALALRGARRGVITWIGLALVAVFAAIAPPLQFVDVPPGGRVVSYREGAMAAVSVVETADGSAHLRINNRQQEGSSATRLTDARQAFLPLLLHPAPRHALFLGLGTGVTASAAVEDRSLQVDAVELLPEVVAASEHFVASSGRPAKVMTADARRFVKVTSSVYDVIVADNFHPARSGSGSLYTAEHFQAIGQRLTEQGVFCQWLPLHQLDLPTLRGIVRTFVAVYPSASALLATNSLETPVLGLVARRDAKPFDLVGSRLRLARLAPARPLADYGLSDDLSLFGSFVAGPDALARFAGDSLVNTDDRPIVAYRAPRITYAPTSSPDERLLSLLSELHAKPLEATSVLDAGSEPSWRGRLTAYWRARDGFLRAGQGVHASADVRQMLTQVREPLLGVLRVSPDFRPAYDPLIRMAAQLSRTDPEQARALFTELAQVQPARPEAAQWLDRLSRQSTSP
jgi:spermidine synthase